MTASPTLPTGPHEHLALDFEGLRAEGLRLLGRLAGAQWTDFNAHDPGVTILEQLCYAITDLAYRISHPIPDLIAGGDPDALPGPAAILTCDPVTATDLRKLVLDVDGVRSASVEPLGEPDPPVYFHAGSGELRLQPDPSALEARPLRLAGLHRVLLQTGDRLPAELALARVAARLHAHRGLGEDYALALRGTHEVWIHARIEVGPTDDPAALQAELFDRIDAHLSPAVRFTGLADARAAGRRLDELYEGPALARGFLDGDLPEPRRTLRASDLLHVLTDVPGVRAVRSLALGASPDGPRDRWAIQVPPDKVAVLAPSSEFILLRAGLPLRVDPARVRALLAERRNAQARPPAPGDPAGPPPGRDRDLARVRSIQHQFPATYGIGALGLPAAASPARKAQARQLAAYLLIFDQLLANAFAQLAHARDLLSPAVGASPTYFAQPVDDPGLDLAALLRKDPAAFKTWLEGQVEATQTGDGPLARRQRFLAHLLARFAEDVGDYAQIGGDPGDGAALVEARAAFLRRVARLGAARGAGRDLLAGDDPSGLEQRLRLKLGLQGGPRFHLVEHVLLRPVAEDLRQLGDDDLPQVPLLAGAAGPDPWSLQVSFVFEARDGGAPGDAFETMVAAAILAETPAHLRPHLHWFDAAGDDSFAAFEAAWSAFRAADRVYRHAKLRAALVPDPVHLRLRDARDRLIELLGLGRTYPLRDLPVPARLMVPPNLPTAIPVDHTQRGVVYTLCDRTTGAPILVDGERLELEGTGGRILLPTPPITKDFTFRILATKLAGKDTPQRREAWLHGVVVVQEGVDPTVVARLRLPPLDPDVVAPKPDDARIADHGALVEVEILDSQEGIVYELVDDADRDDVVSLQPVLGKSGVVVLATTATEDIDLRVRGTRPGDDDQPGGLRRALLDLVLPLRVRADATLLVTPQPGPTLAHADPQAALHLAATQTSASYRLWRRRVRDRDFVLADPPGVATLAVPGDDGHTIRIARPVQPIPWSDLEPVGPALPGTGGPLVLPLAAPVADACLFVQAIKRHRKRPGGEDRIVTTVQLTHVQPIFVRPDPARVLHLEAAPAGDPTTAVQLRGGQPGVYYQLRDGDVLLGAPAYFHQRDDLDPQLNKGLDQLVLAADFAIARTDPDPQDPGQAPPLPPVVDLPPPAPDAVLRLRARKAFSGLLAELQRVVTLPPVPAIQAQPAAVQPGGSATIVIAASVVGERYSLRAGDTLLAAADGTGGPLELATGPLTETTRITVVVARRDPAEHDLDRLAALTIEVHP